MPKFQRFFLPLLLFTLSACSPRDFLSRRLAADLIQISPAFRSLQQVQLSTGIVSNDAYQSPTTVALQHRGWLSASNIRCPPASAPPCWDLNLTPAGVEALQNIIPASDADKKIFTISSARREFLTITGISKQSNYAEVEFTWRWNPLNEVGAALNSPDQRYHSIAALRKFDDGWRIAHTQPRPSESLEDSLRNADPLSPNP